MPNRLIGQGSTDLNVEPVSAVLSAALRIWKFKRIWTSKIQTVNWRVSQAAWLHYTLRTCNAFAHGRL